MRSFYIEGYKTISVPRTESISKNRRNIRGHGGICLLLKENISNDIRVLETNASGFILIKLMRNFFNLENEICLCCT